MSTASADHAGRRTQLHAAPTAAAHGLDQQRRARCAQQGLRPHPAAVHSAARHHGHLRAATACARARSLSPTASICAAVGPMKATPSSSHSHGEGCALRQESIARMDGLRTGTQRSLHDGVGIVQIGLGRMAPVRCRPRDRHDARAVSRDPLQKQPARSRFPVCGSCA